MYIAGPISKAPSIVVYKIKNWSPLYVDLEIAYQTTHERIDIQVAFTCDIYTSATQMLPPSLTNIK